jgi:hypothetical protein
MKFTHVLYLFNPLFNFPPREGRAFKDNPVDYFSDGARLQGRPSPVGEGWDGGKIIIREVFWWTKNYKDQLKA